MDILELLGAMVHSYSDDALIQDHRYKHVVANHLGLAIGSEDIKS